MLKNKYLFEIYKKILLKKKINFAIIQCVLIVRHQLIIVKNVVKMEKLALNVLLTVSHHIFLKDLVWHHVQMDMVSIFIILYNFSYSYLL